MSIDTEELRSLPPAEKLRIVEMLWDELGEMTAPIPLPEWADNEAARRREELRDSSFGMSHDEAWRRINERNNG